MKEYNKVKNKPYDVVYIENWEQKYKDCKSVKYWFDEWNKRWKVILWDILQFFHKDNQTIVEWKFKCIYDDVVSECDKFVLKKEILYQSLIKKLIKYVMIE